MPASVLIASESGPPRVDTGEHRGSSQRSNLTSTPAPARARLRVVAGQRHVLVVEDDSPIRAMIADLLSEAGYAVIEAADGFEALRQLRHTRPDLIVLDLMLPGMSGWQFLERSREQLDRAGVPVVILSAIRGEGDYPRALGVAAWLTKPLDVDRFLSAVDELSAPALPGARHTQEAARVLVVEDEPVIRELLVEHLAEEGFEPQAAGSIAEARSHLAGVDRPALILLDLMLPGESGAAFLRERSSDPGLAAIPVLVISAAGEEQLLEAKDLGGNAFLSKPFDLGLLSAVVRSFVAT
jgi:DNA-binding response OmpR family regulator